MTEKIHLEKKKKFIEANLAADIFFRRKSNALSGTNFH